MCVKPNFNKLHYFYSCFFFGLTIFLIKNENSFSFQSISTRFKTNLLVEMLWSGPKAMATAVQAKQITLYGILKSGVGRLINKDSVLNCTIYPSLEALKLKI